MSQTRKRKAKRPAAGQNRPAAESRADIGRIIENGFAMLMPFIVERIVAAATAPERHSPQPESPYRVQYERAYKRGYEAGHEDGGTDMVQWVPFPSSGCKCEACRCLDVWADKFGRVSGVTGDVKQ